MNTPPPPASPRPVTDRAALVERLRAAGCVFAEDEADLLVAAASGPAELSALAERRAAGLPLEHVLGWAEFRGVRVRVDPGVFVPRRRSEYLALRAVERVPAAGAPVVVDLCCGSGALGAAVKRARPDVELHAADVDAAAVRCARANVAAAGGGTVHRGDLFDALPARLRGRVAVLIANVPYVPSAEIGLLPPEAREHEPAAALDGGPDGLDVLRRVAAGAPRWLAPGGAVLAETGERQAEPALAVLRRAGLAAEATRSDDLDATVVAAVAADG